MNSVGTIRIRRGKSVEISFDVTTNEQYLPLAGRIFEVEVQGPNRQKKNLKFSVDGHTLKLYFREMRLGRYTFTLHENWEDDLKATAVDIPTTIELVERTWMEGGTATEGLDVETVNLGTVNLTVQNGSSSGGNVPLTKEAVEAVLTGDITSHNHHTQIQKELTEALADYAPNSAVEKLQQEVDKFHKIIFVKKTNEVTI